MELILHCDVSNEKIIDNAFEIIEKKWGTLDFLVHAIAFSDKNELDGKYVNTSLDNFLNAMHISCYSFTALAQRAEKMMSGGGSLLTLSYYGAEKVMPNYNVMGLCKAALEASVKYIACDRSRATKYQSKCNFRWSNQNFSIFWNKRFSLHIRME